MLQATSFANQGKLASAYRAADIHRAATDRAVAEAKRSDAVTLVEIGAPRVAVQPISRLLALLPHAR